MAFLCLAASAAAFADAVVVFDERSLFVRNASCTIPCPVELTKEPPFLFPFDDIITGPGFGDWSSSQISSLQPDEMSGVGYTDAFTSLGEGRSRFDVTFSLDEPHAFDLTGEIEAEGDGAAIAVLTDEDAALPLFLYTAGSSVGGPLSQPLDEAGILPSGLYRLEVEGVVVPGLGQGGDADWSFVLTLPEPDPHGQLLAGIVALATLHGLRRSSERPATR